MIDGEDLDGTVGGGRRQILSRAVPAAGARSIAIAPAFD